jgi:hypothetical protein
MSRDRLQGRKGATQTDWLSVTFLNLTVRLVRSRTALQEKRENERTERTRGQIPHTHKRSPCVKLLSWDR